MLVDGKLNCFLLPQNLVEPAQIEQAPRLKTCCMSRHGHRSSHPIPASWRWIFGQIITYIFSVDEADLIAKINPKLEGNTALLKNPHPPNSLAFATWVIARLGGWKGYKTHRPPEIGTISRGLIRSFQIKNDVAFLSVDVVLIPQGASLESFYFKEQK